jgi:hypothetical protein
VHTTRKLQWAVPLLVLSTSLGCAAAHVASNPSAEDRAQRDALAPPILALLGQRDRLTLTTEQVAALDSIHRDWSAENDRLTRRGTVVSAGMGGASAGPSRVAPSGPEARANHVRAARAVEGVLDREQQVAVCDLHRSGREAVHRLWPWCDR